MSISIAAVDNRNGKTAKVTVDSPDTNVNRVYTRPSGSGSSGTWTQAKDTADANVEFTGPSEVNIKLTPGVYDVKLVSEDVAGDQDADITHVRTTSPVYKTARYRVVQVLRMPGAPTKELVLERIERPVHP